MTPSSQYNKMRHDLRTFLNHISGYAELLNADAREYGKIDLLPGIQLVLTKAEELKLVIKHHFDVDDPGVGLAQAQQIRQDLFSPLMQVIADSRRLLSQFKSQAPQFVRDLEQLISEANLMHELIESELINIELMQLGNTQAPIDPEILPDSFTIFSDDSIQGQVARVPAHVLVIDDSIVYHRLIRRHLEALGYTVTCLEDASSALKFLTQNPVDIIILDVLMPEIPGSNLLKIIKQDRKLAGIPVIMMSALANSSSIAQCIRLGAEDYLPKDFDPIILKARLDTCLEKKILQQQQNVFMEALLESQKTLAGELADAAEYVVSLLPPPLDAAVKGAVQLIPSAQLGGDFCSYHWIDPEHLCMYLLDVSGHGVKSSLLAVSVSNIIINQGIPGTNFLKPAEVMDGINKAFQRSTYQSFFYCLWYGVFDTTSQILTYASGGSPPACIIRKKEPSLVEELETGDLVLGAVEDYQYSESSVKMNPGDKLFIYSDGLYEITKSNKTCLGLNEFQRLLPLLGKEPLKNIENLIQSILSLTKKEQFEDDVSIIALEF